MTDNFWARKLGVDTTPAPTPFKRSDTLFPVYAPTEVSQGTVPSQHMAVPQGSDTQREEYRPTVRISKGDICPGCGGDKYFRAQPSYMPTCGECGYNPRFEQQAYGAPTLKSDPKDVAPSRQVGGGQTMQGAIAALNMGQGERIG